MHTGITLWVQNMRLAGKHPLVHYFLTTYFRVYTRPYLTFHIINAAADIYSKPACLFWKTALRNSSGKIIIIHPLHKGMPFLLQIKWAKSRTWKKPFCWLYRQDQVEFFLVRRGSCPYECPNKKFPESRHFCSDDPLRSRIFRGLWLNKSQDRNNTVNRH